MKTHAPGQPDLSIEIPLWQSGVIHLAGLDEAGRGCWAGPVAAGAVILPADPQILTRLSGVRDSKQMTSRQRTSWAVIIRDTALAWATASASAQEIDAHGILPATRLAMQRAIESLNFPVQHLLIDALRLPQVELPQSNLIKGDARCLSIAAASVLAKTWRDEYMCNADQEFPGYEFSHHKGYGTAVHRQALQTLGVCSLHRRSFAPVRALLEINTTTSQTTR
ncbi:MAG TPA: ribonuclease HII [Anaerolineaceae bacterium]